MPIQREITIGKWNYFSYCIFNGVEENKTKIIYKRRKVITRGEGQQKLWKTLRKTGGRQTDIRRVGFGVQQSRLEYTSPVLAYDPARWHGLWQLLQERLLPVLHVPGQNWQELDAKEERKYIKTQRMWGNQSTEALPAPAGVPPAFCPSKSGNCLSQMPCST